jgi:phage/plasmid-associated DNA primase
MDLLWDGVLQDAAAHGLRKDDRDSVYEPLPGRHCAFARRGSFHAHVRAPLLGWGLALSNAKRLSNFLADHPELPDFPRLERDPRLVSFADGVLDIGSMAFVTHAAIDADPAHPLRAKAARNHIEAPWLGAGAAPNFSKVLDDQFGDRPQQGRLLRALLGRALFRVGELDGWGAAPYLWGGGGNGKTVVLRTLGLLFRGDAVGFIDPNGRGARGRFFLEALLDREVLLGHEMPARFEDALRRGDAQDMISGQAVTVNRRRRTPALVPRWTAPLVMVSNHPPPEWGGRSFSAFHFDRPPTGAADHGLAPRIAEEELPAVMRIILESYHGLRAELGPDAAPAAP